MSILEEREKTHGYYSDVARVSQALKRVLFSEPQDLSHEQRESLEMMCVKMARIVCGNPNAPDHWCDISGYAELISKTLQAASGSSPQQEPPDDKIKRCAVCNAWRSGTRCLRDHCPGWRS